MLSTRLTSFWGSISKVPPRSGYRYFHKSCSSHANLLGRAKIIHDKSYINLASCYHPTSSCHRQLTEKQNRKNYRDDESNDREPHRPLLAAAGFVTAFLSFLGWEDLLAKEDPLILTIKRGILSMQREEFDKAELIFHAALTTSVTNGNDQAIIYIYSLLGNNSFLKGEYDKSEKIYKDVISRLLRQGFDDTHEAIIEISLKLATIFSKRGDFDKAEIGFTHCLRIQRKRTEKIDLAGELDPNENADEINSLALLGMALDWYGKHFLRKREFEKSLQYTKEALTISQKVNGKNSHQTMVLLSDIGTLLNLTNQFDQANEHFQKAVKIGSILESDHLKTLYYNMGMNNIMRRQWSLAKQNCDTSYAFAERDKDEIITKMASECLKKAAAEEP